MSPLLRLIIAAVSYLVIGIIIQAGMRGARGVEVIPNLSFWKDFPFLLKVYKIHSLTCSVVHVLTVELAL